MKNIKPVRRSFFTLIELIISVIVIGILVAIIVPNVGGLKTESTTAAMQGNIKNLETAVTMYALEHHGEYPTPAVPTLGHPQPLLLDKLHPDQIRKLPKVKGMKYWVDYTGVVWASSADSPLGVFYGTTGKLTWEEVENAESYSVFKVSAGKTKSAANKQEITFIQHTEKLEVDLPEPKEGETYLVSSTDKFSLESPPASSEYQGYILPGQVLGELAPGDSQKEPFPWPLNKEQPIWKNSDPALRDGDANTYYRAGSQDYTIEWNGDMANRVFQLDFKPAYGPDNAYKDITFLDAEGNQIPFINAKTDEVYSSYKSRIFGPRVVIDFVVPRGAVKLLIKGPLTIDLYKADFVKDLSLPQAVSNVKSTVTDETITLTWDIPSGKNFLKTAIYHNDKFVGYGENGTFTHKSLYSNMEYSYYIEPVSVVGNRGQRVYHMNKTNSKEINWRGLNSAEAFDSSLTTFTSSKAGDEISWEGDLTDRQIQLQHRTPRGISNIQFAFYDSNNKIVKSKMANNNEEKEVHTDRSSSTGTFITKFVVPEGAVKLRVVSVEYNSTIDFYDISHGNTLELPSKLTKAKAVPTTESVTLTFNKPEDVARVGIWRDGVFLAYSTAATYEDKSLHSDRLYNYTFETFNVAGNRTADGGKVSVTTERPEIVWKGLSSGAAFDSSLTTFASSKAGDEISWEGDLTDRQIQLQHRTPRGISNIQFAFYDSNNKIVKSKMANNNEEKEVHTDRSSSTGTFITKFVVPEGAVKLRVVSVEYNSTIDFYHISYGSTLELPSRLTNVKAEPTTESINLTFNKPSDVTRVGIWRDGVFLAYSTAATYEDKSLHSDRLYNYTFETFNVAGNRTADGGKVSVTTERTDIVWRGLNSGAAFDSSMTTFTSSKAGDEISWEGNLTNRQIQLHYRTPNGIMAVQLGFYDSANKLVKSKMENNNIERDIHTFNGHSVTLKNSKFIVPEGATKLKVVSVESNKTIDFYHISHGGTLELPSNLTNVKAEPTTESVILTFNKPIDVTRVGVWRDGMFLAYTSNPTYEDKSLHSDRRYNYTFETFNAAGNRTAFGGEVSATTERTAEIVWRGLNTGAAFDSSMSTFTSSKAGDEISWEGNLTDRQIQLHYRTPNGIMAVQLAFYDSNNKIVKSKMVNTSTEREFHSFNGSSVTLKVVNFVVPEGATKLKVTSVESSKTVDFYHITHN